MFRGYGSRDMAAWTAIICLVAFGVGVVAVKRLRPAGPIEFHELPAASGTPQARQTTPAPAAPVQPAPTPTNQPEDRVDSVTAQAAPDTEPAGDPSPPPARARGRTKVEPALQSVSINGDVEELEQLPGVGPTIAQRIVDYRTEHGPFESIDELRNVRGIGQKRFDRLSPYLRL